MVILLFAGLPSFSQSLTPLVIGTIHPNDSVVIYYDVTINAGAGSQISNQGTITGTGINTVTDDPDTGPANDPTITPLNMFPLPVRLMDIKARWNGAAIEVAWNVASESGMVKYEIEKSTTGRNFVKIGEVSALNRTAVAAYSFPDHNPVAGSNFYRLRLIDANAAATYSLTTRVDMDGRNTQIRIFPNPVRSQRITVQLNNLQKGVYELVFSNSLGQVAYRTAVDHDGGSLTRIVSLPAGFKGVYGVQLKSENVLFKQLLIVL